MPSQDPLGDIDRAVSRALASGSRPGRAEKSAAIIAARAALPDARAAVAEGAVSADTLLQLYVVARAEWLLSAKYDPAWDRSPVPAASIIAWLGAGDVS